MIKAVIFDIDGTLYSYDDAHAVAWEPLCAYAKEHLGMDAEQFAAQVKQSTKICNARMGANCGSTHNRMLRFQDILERHKLPLRHAWHMNDLYWRTLIDASRPEPGVEACLKQLKAQGMILGIGTDMTADFQFVKLEKLGLIDYFDFMVSSEETNIEKPDPKVFLTCAAKAGVAPEECLFVGDSLKKDVLGPKAVGMHAIWYVPDRDKALTHPEVERITHYDELMDKLSRL